MDLRKYIALSIIILTLGWTSCTDEFEEMNQPEDLLVEELVNVDLMFTRVMAYITVLDADNGFGTVGNYSGMSVSGANRPFAAGESAGVWNDTYTNYARNLADIINIGQKREQEEGSDEYVNKIAIARIMKAWAFARCTDVYGDIPYFESSLPIEQAVLTPAYDAQQDIYLDLFQELKEAAEALDPEKPSYEEADILYNGDVEKWRKFANSLRLRLAMRLRYVDEELARSNMSDLTEPDLIVTREDDAYVYTQTDFPNHMNALWVDLVARGEIVVKNSMPKTFLDILKNNEDPRLEVFADTAKAEWPGTPGFEEYDYFGYRGMPLLGLSPPAYKYPYGDESVSRWSDLLWVQVIERPLFKASETYFLLAEAALFGLKDPADAQSYYTKGLQLALEHTKEFYETSVPQLPDVIELFRPEATEDDIARYIAEKAITQEEIGYFLANAPVAVLSGTEEEKLEQIINQKMIALFPQEHEAWAEYRRTGYPRILIGPDDDQLMGQIPRRFPYPTDEQNLNGGSYEAAVSAIGGSDTRLTRIWWDANPNPMKEHPEEVEQRPNPYR